MKLKLKNLAALSKMTDDQLAKERQKADEEMQDLRDYKRKIQSIGDERDIEARAAKVAEGLDPAGRAALAQALTGIGDIKTDEKVDGLS